MQMDCQPAEHSRVPCRRLSLAPDDVGIQHASRAFCTQEKTMKYGYLHGPDYNGLFRTICLRRPSFASKRLFGDGIRTYEVNDHLFFLVQKYRTKAQNDARFESHRRYADLQYVVSGEETAWVCNTSDMLALSASMRKKMWVTFGTPIANRFEAYPGNICGFHAE